MGTKQNTIEINGKRYDARTGKLMDGHQAPTKVAVKPATPSRRITSDIARGPATQAKRTPQRSQTLMRTAVKKPKPTLRHNIKPAAHKTVSDFTPTVRKNTNQVTLHAPQEKDRQVRAKSIKQNKLVSKFSDFGVKYTPIISTPAVAQRPEALPAKQSVSVKHRAVVPAHKIAAQSIIDKGLKAAQSHNETLQKPHKSHHKSKKGRFARLGAASLAVFLLAGFIAYQNVPNISMRYAAARSGVEATLPGYKPSGFALNNHIQYNPGQITVKFASNSDERNFTITQRESNWNSDTLMTNYVTSTEEQVQTYEDKGRTIYLYGESNATWVNGGVWYEIKGDAQLTSDQLIRIATSM